MFDLVINDGQVVLPSGRQTASIAISDGIIRTIQTKPLDGYRTIDANGLIVLPGVIDSHVHFQLYQGQEPDATHTADDYTTGPLQAAHGGVTTFVDYAIPHGRRPLDEIHDRVTQAERGSCIDFAFHCGIVDPVPESLQDMVRLSEEGITSFKFFLTYKRWGFGVDRGFLREALTTCRQDGAIAAVHCEDDDIIEYEREKHHRAGETALIWHSWTRPPISESLAVQDVAALAEDTGAAVHVVHLSTARGLDVIRHARSHGVDISTETCPHYLAFSDDIYRSEQGYLYTMTPPLRPPGNREALWSGLQDGSIELVASDHNCFTKAQKLAPDARDFYTVAPGVAGTETLLPFLYTYGVARGRLGLEDVARLLSFAPAQRFGLAQKGLIQVGADADLVVLDPGLTRRPTTDHVLSPAGYSIFEDIELSGWPVYTISRGRIVFDHDRFVGQPGHGRYVARRPRPNPR
jgi:dihydropyrimidinase